MIFIITIGEYGDALSAEIALILKLFCFFLEGGESISGVDINECVELVTEIDIDRSLLCQP